jgi:uncharacterized membrane protein
LFQTLFFEAKLVAPSHLQEQIDIIARHERDFLEHRSRSERIVDSIAGFAGSLTFAIVQTLFAVAWVAWNILPSTASRHFDAAPFPLLGVLLALEAILLTCFVLIRQSRLSRRSDERAHLELQVLLLADKEITAVLVLCTAIAEKLGLRDLAAQEDIQALSEETPIDDVAKSINKSLPKES